jgi:hypothetical protein
MSEVKVNKVSPRSGTGLQLGDSGDTVTIPSGATIDNQGTALNFGATGSASWSTTVKTGDFTAVAGEGYFVDTSSGPVTVTLPASPTAGDVVAFKDYANTFDTNVLNINRNGKPIGGSAENKKMGTEGIAATLIYVDGTKGWLVTDDGLQSNVQPLTYTVDFLVVAGGGGGGYDRGAGGGAGGYRNSYNSETSGGGASSETALELNIGTVYTITVGDGGANQTGNTARGNDGVASSISGTGITTITSAGGGGGGTGNTPSAVYDGGDGGSGGGAIRSGAAGTGTVAQGFNGGGSSSTTDAGGGGGAGEAGDTDGSGEGGDGLSSAINGATDRGGGGGGHQGPSRGTGGTGGGGNGGADPGIPGATPGTANTGGGGGGAAGTGPSFIGQAGGSGVVILRMATSDYSGTTSGSPTVTTSGSDTILTYNASGSYTA